MSKKKKRRAHKLPRSGSLLPASAARRKLRTIDPLVETAPERALELLEEMATRYHLPGSYYTVKAIALLRCEADMKDVLRAVLQAEPDQSSFGSTLRFRGIAEAAAGYFAAAYQDLTAARSELGIHASSTNLDEEIERVEMAAPDRVAELGLRWPEDTAIAGDLDRCNALARVGLRTRAVDQLQDVVARAPGSSIARYHLADELWAVCRFDEAVAAIPRPEDTTDAAVLFCGAKFNALLGRPDTARTYSDRLAQLPITESEHFAFAVRAHAWAGGAERVCETVEAHPELGRDRDSGTWKEIVHLEAVARARLGDRDAAVALWQEIGIGSSILVRDNYLAVEASEDARPWYFALEELIPDAVDYLLRERHATFANRPFIARSEYPRILEILPQFESFGGPSAVRFANIALDIDEERADDDPSSIVIGGYTVYTEPVGSPPQEIAELSAQALNLLSDDRPETAEGLLRDALAKAPDEPFLHQNLAAALERQGKTEEAMECIRNLHARFPDYLFARCAVALQAARSDNLEEAHALVAPVLEQEAMHFMEFGALCNAMCGIAAAENEWTEVERWVDLWRISDPGNPAPDSFELEARLMGGLERLQRSSARSESRDRSAGRSNSRRRRKPKRDSGDPRQLELF